MTPAINLLKKRGIAHRVLSYHHDPATGSYGGEAVQQLGLDPAQVFKTLLASTEKHELLVAIVPVSGMLDLKALAEAAGCRKCEMADIDAAQRATGYLVGGISPLGQKKKHRTFIDASAQTLPTLHVSAGRRGLEVALAPSDLLALTEGHYAPIGRPQA
jgi:Cys-tRNA(Pro)/Cys-tRNA(Cys) deacylase